MPILVLENDVAAKIAAGEVVERPASVVKELVENALDAGASQIEIEVRNGGTRLIRVTDDAAGIPESELQIAFQRHATSKINREIDLRAIQTFGFRGEALPSIAAVADILCTSRPRDEDSASYLRIENGAVVEQGRQGAPFGTTMIVRDLFRSVPARLKFLKSNASESTAIVRIVTSTALAFPDVSFRLLADDRLMFHSPGNGDARDVLVEVYGLDTAQAMLPLDNAEWSGPVSVTGFVSPPDVTRSRRDQQAFFVNNRWIQSRLISYALDDFYREILPKGRHPIAVLNVTMPPEEVDVNVHPTKAEVRFRRDGDVFSALQRVLRQTFAAHDSSFAITNEAAPPPIAPFPVAAGDGADQPQLLFDVSEPTEDRPPVQSAVIMRPVGQVGTTYIVAEGPDGMYLVDQHAAHERLRFDELMSKAEQRDVDVQGLLEPQSIELNLAQRAALTEIGDGLETFGFRWEPFGEGSALLRGVPADLREGESVQTFLEVLDSLTQEQTPPQERERAIAALVACHSTVRAGQVLSVPEMDGLLRQMSEAGFPKLCPHGRPTMMHFSAAQIDKEFRRR